MVKWKTSEYVDALKQALEYAQNETDALPLSVPAPLRDIFLHNIVQKYVHDAEPPGNHNASQCDRCLNIAFQWSLYTLGWDDRKTARPTSAKERMVMLKDQLMEALAVLQGLGPHED